MPRLPAARQHAAFLPADKPQDDLTQSSFSLPTADCDDCHSNKGELIENGQSKVSLLSGSVHSHGGSSGIGADASE